jgi:hypothetical protein
LYSTIFKKLLKPTAWAFFILSLLVGQFPGSSPVQSANDYTVTGNTVSISGSDSYIEATPATLTASGWVEVMFWTRNYTGPVDVVYGFNGLDNVKAINPEVWESYEHTKYRQVSAVKTAEFKPTKIISTNTTALRSTKADTDLSLNSKYAEIVYEHTDPMMKTTERTIKLAYDTYDAAKGTYLYKYNGTDTETYYETYTDWNRKSQPVVNTLSYAGANKWDIASHGNVAPYQIQRTRVWIDIPFGGVNTMSGKYNIGIKPSSLTLQQAKDQGKLWLLDPWYSASWSYRKAITVTNASADYQTKILIGKTSGADGEEVDCAGHCEDDFDDLRFTGADGTTLLDYWIESSGASGTSYLATVWVQNNATPDTTIYMYYGNAGASAVGLDLAAGKATFLFFDDFNNGTTLDAQWNSKSGNYSVASGNLLPSTTGIIRATGTSVSTCRNKFRTKNAANTDSGARTGLSNSAITTTHYADKAIEMVLYSNAREYALSFAAATYQNDSASYTGNQYYLLEYVWVSGTSVAFFVDGASYGSTTTANQIPAVTMNPRIDGGSNAYLDWYFIGKYTATEPTFAFGSEAVPSCALTGTVTTAVESDIVTGGETIILTLTNSTWVASGAVFNAIRDDIIAGMDSAQNEAGGWDAKYKAEAATYVADVVRTNDTVVTVTMSALAAYSITANETITVTVPTAALVTTAALVASPTFVITNETAGATVTTQAGSSVEATTATGNGNITNLNGGANCSNRGICYSSINNPPTTADSKVDEAGSFGTGAFTEALTGLSTGTTYYLRAYAIQTGNTTYGATVTILTKPAAPTGVSATDGTDTAKVVITWTKSTGATDYHVWRDAVDLGAAGDVATADDAAADASVITEGAASATDGTLSTEVTLSLVGASVANGTTHTYKVVASNATGNSADSSTNTGYRGHGALTYQWQVSAADSDAAYGNIGGGTTDPYSYTSAPAPTITAGNATASDATSSTHSTLTATTPPSAANGAGRYYKCVLDATGATQKTTAFNTGYRGTTTLTFAWQRSAADLDAAFGAIGGGTTNPYNDVAAVIDPDGRYYYCIVSMVGATPADTTHNRGNRSAFAAPTVVTGICSGSGTTWAILNGNVTDIGDAAVTQTGFEYGLTTGYGSLSPMNGGILGAGAYFSALPILSSSTIYHYRAAAFNGAWGYGADAIFATKGSPAITTYFNAGSDNCTPIYGINVSAQSFTTDNATEYSVTSVRLELLRVGSPGTVTVAIRHAAGNVPTGTNLTSGMINGNLLGTSAAWYDIVMSTEETLELDSSYAIMVSASSGDAANYVCWRKVNAGGYAGGTGSTSANSGVSWTAQTWDQMFELWGNPALEIQDVKVFQSYKATGDWIITARYVNTFAPYYDTFDVKKYFVIQLVDATGIVKASTLVPSWGNRIASIYLSSTTVTPLTYGGDYRVRIQGTFAAAPYTEYALADTDWLGDDLENLDSWVLTSATVLGTYDSTTYTAYVAGRGEVLNATGGSMFATGISGLTTERPEIFQIYTTPNVYTPNPTTQTYRQTTSNWQANWGADGQLMVERLAGILSIPAADAGFVAAGFFIAMMLILALTAFPAGHTTAANVLSVIFLVTGIGFGLDLIYIILIGLFAAFLLFKNAFMDR